jgi:hypothetical protein
MSTPVPKTAPVFPLAFDGAAMGGSVYAASQAAKNDQPADGEVARQALGHPQSVRRGMAGAYDRDPGLGDRIHIPSHMENQRGS